MGKDLLENTKQIRISILQVEHEVANIYGEREDQTEVLRKANEHQLQGHVELDRVMQELEEVQREVWKVRKEVQQVKDVMQDLQTSLLDLPEVVPTGARGKGK